MGSNNIKQLLSLVQTATDSKSRDWQRDEEEIRTVLQTQHDYQLHSTQRRDKIQEDRIRRKA
jgi:hypothetical protein